MEVAELWWESITGPASLTEQIVTQLRAKRSVLLRVPNDLPWRKQMRRSVEYKLRENETDLLLTYIDCQDDCPDITDIPEFLMETFSYSENRNGYRASSGESIHKYMLKTGVLKNQVLWVKGMSTLQTEKWYSFCKKYQTSSLYDGLFVIETYGDISTAGNPGHISQVRYDDRVSVYDALLFNSILAATSDYTTEWKQYIATVASTLCSCDVELSEKLITNTDFTATDPVEALRELYKDEHFERRRDAIDLGSEHPFALLRQGKDEELYMRVWKAQLQTLFTLAEIERIAFIDKFRDMIEEALGTRYFDFGSTDGAYVTQFDERLANAYDAEIGTLARMMRLKKLSDPSEYLFYIPHEKDRNYFKLLHSIRNALAHTEACSVEDVRRLLEAHPHSW